MESAVNYFSTILEVIVRFLGFQMTGVSFVFVNKDEWQRSDTFRFCGIILLNIFGLLICLLPLFIEAITTKIFRTNIFGLMFLKNSYIRFLYLH